MAFVNPIEILELQNLTFHQITDDIIKKKKKKVLIDIELSDDGYFDYYEHKLTKSDCEKVIAELEDNDIRDYYYQLATVAKSLNNYLIISDEIFFKNFVLESIYQLPEFINFINPSFAYNFDKSLLKSFKSSDTNMVANILRTKNLINLSNVNNAFKSLTFEIQNRILEIDKISQEIKNERFTYSTDTIKKVLNKVKQDLPVATINLLPSYFQSQLNKIASTINHLQLLIDDKFTDTQISLDLLSYLLLFNIESVNKPIFEKNYLIVKRKNDNKIEQEKNEPILNEWTNILLGIENVSKDIEAKLITAKTAQTKLTAAFNIERLNSLPHFGNEIKNLFAIAIRGLSVSVWNTYGDINIAIAIIHEAQKIDVNDDTKIKLRDSLNHLYGLKEKIKDNERNDLNELITLIENINSQIHLHGMINIKADKVKQMLNDIFLQNATIDSLTVSNEILLKRKLYTELEKILIKLDAFWTNAFLKSIRPIGNNDGELAVKIEKGISGLEFKAKNVLTNVGTGLGKANKEMVRTLPPQLTMIIYLIIIGLIISLIGALFSGC